MACGQPVLEQTPLDANRLNRLSAAAPGKLVKKMRTASRTHAIPSPDSLGEKRIITALVMDVVGSNRLAEQLDLEIWMSVIKAPSDRVAPAIYKYEGTIVRLLGDSLWRFSVHQSPRR
jgi:class 3 adenylate cyclase